MGTRRAFTAIAVTSFALFATHLAFLDYRGSSTPSLLKGSQGPVQASNQVGKVYRPSQARAVARNEIGRREAGNHAMRLLASSILLRTLPAYSANSGRSRSDVSLLSADPLFDPKEILRRALPIENPALDNLQSKLFSMTKSLGASSFVEFRDSNTVVGVTGIEPKKRRIMALGDLKSYVRECDTILKSSANDILSLSSDSKKKGEIQSTFQALTQDVSQLQSLLNSKDPSPDSVFDVQQRALERVGKLKELSVEKFPFEIPKDLASDERLKGRATVEMRVKSKDMGGKPRTEVIRMVVDGYNAPITAGRFVGLAANRFYDGMPIQRSDGFIVQSGQSSASTKMSKIPLEIKVEGQDVPVYGDTLENLSRFDERVILPFNSLGTLAMSRNVDDPNSADTQFFWLLKENDLTPSGTNVLDGRFSVFGYVVENAAALRDLKVGDVIESVRILDGMKNFEDPGR
ncbi:hypothetical protein AAMO2058_001649400 [Amorphochlora amoebiformis]